MVGIIDVDFSAGLSSDEVETLAAVIERRVREAHPEMVAVYVRPSHLNLLIPAPRPAADRR